VMSDAFTSGTPVLIAMAGRIPVKVTAANGVIQAGDALVASDVPGVAMKATASGVMIGRALEPYDPADTSTIATVMAFVQNGYFVPDMSGTLGSEAVSSTTSTADVVQPAATVQDLAVSGTVTIVGHLALGQDTVGEAKIVTGSKEVRVHFKDAFDFQPI